MSGTDGCINGDRDWEEKVVIMSVSADSDDKDLKVLGLCGRIPQPRQSCLQTWTWDPLVPPLMSQQRTCQ
jgi:hypothetical protein